MKILPELKEIKQLRKKLNINQKELGDSLKISQSTVSRIENETMDPPYSHAKKIFEFLEAKRMVMEKSEKIAENIMTRDIISISPKATIKIAVELMNENGVSQIPIIENGQNIGSLTARKIQKYIADNPDLLHIKVDDVKELPFPEIEKNWALKDISNLLVNYSAILVKEHNKFIGIVTDADFFKIT
jgi:predicted transcriptional regulator